MRFFLELKTWRESVKLVINAIKNDTVFISRRDAIGDVLWTEPVIRKLAVSGKNLVFVTQYPQLFENFPYTNVMIVDRVQKHFKRAVRILKLLKLNRNLIDFRHAYEKNTNKHFLNAYQNVAGVDESMEYPLLYLREEEKNKFRNLRPYVVIHIESQSIWNHRYVYGINWQNIIDYLNDLGFKPYIISKGDSTYKHAYHLPTTLREMISLIYNAKFFIGIDSGPSHIAASLRIPSIIFFGSVNPWYRHFPHLFTGIIMQQKCEYANCYHRENKNISGLPCLLVGNNGIPKCSVHTDEELVQNINKMLSKIGE